MSGAEAALPARQLTGESPFPLRLRAYLAERFPLSVNGPAILVMFASGYLVAASLIGSGASLASWRVPVGMAVLFFFFLRLRISDEHKDVAYDRIVNPERLVVRGVIGLGELKAVAAVGLAVELGGAWWLGPGAFAAYLAALAWSVLMHLEFFCEHWLRSRPGVYMLTHMIVIPLQTIFLYECANPAGVSRPWVPLLAFALSSVLATASLETARKIKQPEDEAEGVESYSSAWGFGASLAVVAAMQALSLGLIFVLASRLGLGPVFLGVAAVSWAVVCAALGKFARGRAPGKPPEKLENAAALYFLTLHIGLTASLWRW